MTNDSAELNEKLDRYEAEIERLTQHVSVLEQVRKEREESLESAVDRLCPAIERFIQEARKVRTFVHGAAFSAAVDELAAAYAEADVARGRRGRTRGEGGDG